MPVWTFQIEYQSYSSDFSKTATERLQEEGHFIHGGQPIEGKEDFFSSVVLGLVDDKGISVGKWLNNYYKKFILNDNWLRGRCRFPFAAL